MQLEDVKKTIRIVPDFPKKGIQFLDITTGVKNAEALNAMIDYLYEQFKDKNIDYVAGIESRGFIFGAPLAMKLNAGFVMIRKPNKLPANTISESYDLEYGKDTIEIHADAIEEGKRVVVIDDLLATGGTACAACNLIKKVGGIVEAAAFIIELTPLNGAKKITEETGVNVVSMLKYDLD
ncbi:TPA: adenine phosphoribosyltransferase [Candidatus Gastranaerophilales bacterium HUM_9]|nr:MAG TPA: adenine phosphoribosyltransferase [Candidatus Gastranaerophilales bacterium HUM_9]HBX35523.1 adenine phosphoribosyltransferase [Cyanobacteria bacterium UBA11440]